jgi:hypothetical protein
MGLGPMIRASAESLIVTARAGTIIAVVSAEVFYAEESAARGMIPSIWSRHHRCSECDLRAN